MEKDVIIVGAGFAGCVAARKLAEAGKTVLVYEKRSHLGGNAYDFMDHNQVMQHVYGPHIFHTNSEKAIDFLSQFTYWYPYEHKVLGYVEGKLVPIPFNLKSIEMCFEEDAEHIKEVLISKYGQGAKVPILKLKENQDPVIRELADYVFEHVFQYYTMKQWDYTVEEIDPSVTGRVPVSVSYDDRYFTDSFQNMPKEGYTKLFEKMMDHPNIEVILDTDALEHMYVDKEQKCIYVEDKIYSGIVIYTGILDELFGYCYGELPYRSLDFELKDVEGEFQPVATVNYPTPKEVHPYTRITEYKWFMQEKPNNSTIAIEYPFAYNRHGDRGNTPYYPVFTKSSEEEYQKYLALLKTIPNLYPLGRLAEYRYYNMDAIVDRALEFVEELLK